MSIFLTDPDNPQEVREHLKGNMDFGLELEQRLMDIGIDIYYARCAVIDMKPLWIPCWRQKLTPTQTASFLASDVRKAYGISNEAIV